MAVTKYTKPSVITAYFTLLAQATKLVICSTSIDPTWTVAQVNTDKLCEVDLARTVDSIGGDFSETTVDGDPVLRVAEKTDMTARKGRDYASVNESTDRLMTDIMSRLKVIRPDIMIEFRQPYIGPLMRKYGNMFRAADCPNMEIVNRVRTTDLRIASGNTAVHSDMFMWHKEDQVESAALQILNILFSVPQLSVKLDSIPEDHFQMVKFWINYWKENKDVLMDGEFIPKNPGALYPVLRSSTIYKEIISVYNDQVIEISNTELTEIDVVNAKGSTNIIFDFEYDYGKTNIYIYDCLGIIQDEFIKDIQTGVLKIMVPPSGLIKFRKN